MGRAAGSAVGWAGDDQILVGGILADFTDAATAQV